MIWFIYDAKPAMQNYYICDEVSHDIWGLFELWLLSVIFFIMP